MINLIKRVRYALILAAAISIFTVAASVSAGGGAYNNSGYSYFVTWQNPGDVNWSSGWYAPGGNSWQVTADGDFFGTSVAHDLWFAGVRWGQLSAYQTFKLNSLQRGYHRGSSGQLPWTDVGYA